MKTPTNKQISLTLASARRKISEANKQVAEIRALTIPVMGRNANILLANSKIALDLAYINLLYISDHFPED
jgi:hypothetical protein